MNILLATEYFFGNPDLVRLSTELSKRGHLVNVITSRPPTFYKFENRDADSHINVVEANPHVDIPNLPYTLSFPFSQIAELIRSQDIEIIHTVMERATNAAAAALISRAVNIPYVHTVQGIGTQTGRPFIDFIAEIYDYTICHMILKWAKKVIILSENLAKRALRLGANVSKIVVIPSGIDSYYFDPDRPEPMEEAQRIRGKLDLGDVPVIGNVGRLVPVKGLKYLLLAMKEVQQEYPKVHLLIVGDGFQRAELERMAQRLKINASFVGWKKNLLPFYTTMDVFVLPSLLEGLSNSLLEAMAMKKPVVATNVGGNPDLITNGKNGFLVSPRNHRKIASALKTLIENTDMRRRMGFNSRQTVKKTFSWDTIVPKVEKVYYGLYATKN